MRGIKYVSRAGTSDHAQAALETVRGLAASGLPVQWVPLCNDAHHRDVPWRAEFGIDALDFPPATADDPAREGLPELIECCCRPCDHDTVLVHLPPDDWPVHFEPGMRNVGYAIGETDSLPAYWLPLLNLPSRVLVPSRACRALFERGGVIVPVRVATDVASLLASLDD